MGKTFLKFQQCLDYSFKYLETWTEAWPSKHSQFCHSTTQNLFKYTENPGLRVKDITQSFFDEMLIDWCRHKLDHGNTYQGHIITTTQTCLNHNIDAGNIPRFTPEQRHELKWVNHEGKYAFIKPDPDESDRPVLTPAQVDHLHATAVKFGLPLIADTTWLACYTGLSWHEWSQLQPRDIDLSGKVPCIYIGHRRDFKVKRGSRKRILYLAPGSPGYERVLPILEKHLDGMEDHQDMPVFGDYWSDDDAHRRQFNRIRDIAGIDKRFTPNCCRHTHATWLAQADVHPEKTRQVMGHSQISTTLKHYTHIASTELVDAVSRIGAPLEHQYA